MNIFWMTALLAAPSGLVSVDEQINAVYERIAEGAKERDPLVSRHAYAPDALFLDERRPVVQAGEMLHDNMRRSMEALKGADAQARISYRIISRSVQANVAIDIGYYRVSITRAGSRDESISYRKFLVTAEQSEDGAWLISNDASLPSSREAYEGAQRFEGARFDVD